MSHKLYFPKIAMCVLALALTSYAQNQPSRAQSSSQTGAGTFSGRLTGAGMDGATVTLTSPTGAVQTAVTDSDGSFNISNLAPGSYRISVKLKSGLQLGESSVEINSSGGGQIQTTFGESIPPVTAGGLELQGRSPTLQTDTAEVSRSYDSQTIRSLPVLDRQNHELVTLMPGITPPTVQQDRINDPQRTRLFNVNGQPSYTNLYNQDGVYDNEPFSGRPLRLLPNEGVQTLEVRTSNYNAEYGTSGGAWQSTLTRPGTNAIHGSLFEFNTNSFFRSGRNLNATQASPRFNTNQFGATAGGPVITDKVFWFLSYEGYMQRGFQEAVATVPTASLLAGNFNQVAGLTLFNPFSGVTPGQPTRVIFPSNNIPAALQNQAALRILALVPQANVAGSSNNLVGRARLLDDTHRMDGKIDHRFSDKSTGFFRYGFTQSSIDQGSILGAVGAPLNAEFRGMNGVASYSHVFMPALLGELRVGYDRYRNQISPWGDFSALNGLSSVGFPNGLPSISISGFTPLGLPANVPSKQIDNVYDGATNWVAHTGINSLKFGISVRALEVNGISNPFFSQYGSFNFGPGATLLSSASAANLSPAVLQANAFAGFLTGTPTQAGISTFPLTPAYRQKQYAAYLADTVNLFQRLWLEIGVRYDVFSPIDPAQAGGAVLFNPTTNSITQVGVNGATNRINRYDLNNFAPRVGLAFRPFDRLVFRAGYGIHYFPVPFSLANFNPAVQGVQVGNATGTANTFFVMPTVPATTATAPNLPFTFGPRDVRTPYYQTLSAMIQGDLGNGFLLDIGYVGNVGRHLPFSRVLAGTPGAVLSATSRTASLFENNTGLNSNYNSLQLNLTKKFAAGLALSGAYTYGKALDYGTNLLDPYTRRNNYGPADWDRTHILSVSHVWRLPFGVNRQYFTNGMAARILGDWELTGILRWATGTPYGVTADPLACACLGVSAVPAAFTSSFTNNMNGSGSFNPAQFSSPAAGTFGTLSRNGFRGPDMFVYNLAVFRNFAVNENIKLELRGEAYNLTNTTNLMNPVSSLSSPGFGSSVGQINGLAGRQFQVAARLLF